jgi:hypothetical protein
MARHGAAREDIRMPSFATLGPASVHRWIWPPAAGCLVVAAVLSRARARRARFTGVPAPTTKCTATVSLLNSAGSSPLGTATARI